MGNKHSEPRRSIVINGHHRTSAAVFTASFRAEREHVFNSGQKKEPRRSSAPGSEPDGRRRSSAQQRSFESATHGSISEKRTSFGVQTRVFEALKVGQHEKIDFILPSLENYTRHYPPLVIPYSHPGLAELLLLTFGLLL